MSFGGVVAGGTGGPWSPIFSIHQKIFRLLLLIKAYGFKFYWKIIDFAPPPNSTGATMSLISVSNS